MRCVFSVAVILEYSSVSLLGTGFAGGVLPRCWARKAIEQCLIDIEDDQRTSGHSTKLQFIASPLEDAFNQANVAIQSAMARPISCGESSWT